MLGSIPEARDSMRRRHFSTALPLYTLPVLQDAARLVGALGMRRQLDELEVSLNRAAESAVPMAKNLLVDAV
jgi:hypothetical protein